MSDPASSTSPDASPPTRQPYVIPFHAVIKLFSPVTLLDEGQATLMMNGQPMTLPVAASQRERLRAAPSEPERLYYVWLWFRTVEGLVTELELAGFAPPKAHEENRTLADEKPAFQIAGRVKAINKDEGLFTLNIEPNRAGHLQEAFSVDVWAALDLMEALWKVGRTMVIGGEYRPGSGRLVAKSVTPKLVGKPLTRPKKVTEAPASSDSQPS